MSRCLSPIWLNSRSMYVPCGKCYNCVSSRRNAWTFRLLCECFHHKKSAFLTLTYDNVHLPLTKFGTMTLVVEHLNMFIKDLRNSKYEFKYYAIGEYGGKHGRPHYHIIIFYDIDIPFNRFWVFGNVHEGSVKPASIHYVSKFHMYPKDRGNLSSSFPPFRSDVQEIGLELPFQLLGL